MRALLCHAFALLALSCTSSTGIEDDEDAVLAAGGKGDGQSISDGDLNARLVLRLANEATAVELAGDVGLSIQVADAIVAARVIAAFDSLAALDAVPHVGTNVVSALQSVARQRWLLEAPLPCADTQWIIDDLGPGRSPSVTFDRAGRIDVVLETPAGFVIYTHAPGASGWSTETLATTYCSPDAGDLGVDASGSLHLACGNGNRVLHATNANAERRWTWRTVYDEAAWNAESPLRPGGGYPGVIFDDAQLLLDVDGRAHVLFPRREVYSSYTQLGYLQHATDHGIWRSNDMPAAGHNPITSLSRVHAALQGERDVAATFAALTANDYVDQVRFSSSRGDDKVVYATSIGWFGEPVFGLGTEPVIVFERIINGGIPILSQRKLSEDLSSDLDIVGGYEIIEGAEVPNVTGRAPAMTTTPDGTMHLIFHDGDTSVVHATHPAGSDWSFEVIGSLPWLRLPSITHQDGSGLLAVAGESSDHVVVARQVCQ